MTVSTDPYYRWSRRSDWGKAPFNDCSPNLVAIKDYGVKTWGGKSLGCHLDRAVVGSNTMSSHAWGSALDFLPDGGSVELLQTVAPFLIQFSKELGINCIHDYKNQRMWKPITGWGSASIGNKGGQWGHIETTPAMWGNGNSVESRIQVPKPIPPVGYNPPSNWGLFPHARSKPALGPGFGYTNGTQQYQGYCQYAFDVMRLKAGQATVLKPGTPTVWTIHSMAACQNVQQFFGLPVNGWMTLETWEVIDGMATDWA